MADFCRQSLEREPRQQASSRICVRLDDSRTSDMLTTLLPAAVVRKSPDTDQHSKIDCGRPDVFAVTAEAPTVPFGYTTRTSHTASIAAFSKIPPHTGVISSKHKMPGRMSSSHRRTRGRDLAFVMTCLHEHSGQSLATAVEEVRCSLTCQNVISLSTITGSSFYTDYWFSPENHPKYS